MSVHRTFAACAALMALTAGQAAAAQNTACFSEHDVNSLISFALPVVMDTTMKTCRPHLSAQGYFATQGDGLVQRYAVRKNPAWPEAKTTLLRIGAKDEKLKDMISGLSDQALQPFAEGLIGQAIAKKIKPQICPVVERMTRILSPLPPENTVEFLSFTVMIAARAEARSRAKAGKPASTDFPVCPA